MLAMNETVRTQFRIMSKAPGERVWRFRHFSGAMPRSHDGALQTIERLNDESPGWSFKVMRRTVRVIESPWQDFRS